MTTSYGKYSNINAVTLADHTHFEKLPHSDRKNILLDRPRPHHTVNTKYDKGDMYGIHWSIGSWIDHRSEHKYDDKL